MLMAACGGGAGSSSVDASAGSAGTSGGGAGGSGVSVTAGRWLRIATTF
jgi:hypothetical protein